MAQMLPYDSLWGAPYAQTAVGSHKGLYILLLYQNRKS